MRREAQPLRSLPPQFDGSTHEVTQGSATSRDGTAIPYFIVRPKAACGPVPTILYGYGGFQISSNHAATRAQDAHPCLSLILCSGPCVDSAAQVRRDDGRGVAGEGRLLRGGQHTWRRRVRPLVASGK